MKKGVSTNPAFKVITGFGAFILIMSLTPTPCLAWGADGHRIVAEIARGILLDANNNDIPDDLPEQCPGG